MQGLPRASLSLLNRADGSVALSHDGYTVIGAVNGPIEAQRRDELPEEAAVDVTIRPASGVGGVRERHLESILTPALRHIILTQNHPRTLIQVTLQIASTPSGDSPAFSQTAQSSQGESILPMLPALLQASVFALLSASIPLSMTLTATIVAVDAADQIVPSPLPRDFHHTKSRHVFAFSSHGGLLVDESEGGFDINTWERVFDAARAVCYHPSKSTMDGDVEMVGEQSETLEDVLRNAFEANTAKDQKWKEDVG